MKEAYYIFLAWAWVALSFYMWMQGEPWNYTVLCLVMAAVTDLKREVVIGKKEK